VEGQAPTDYLVGALDNLPRWPDSRTLAYCDIQVPVEPSGPAAEPELIPEPAKPPVVSRFHQIALEYAVRGIPVFPHPKTRSPAVSKHLASTDEATIDMARNAERAPRIPQQCRIFLLQRRRISA
jgi:hypothetical protein